ncbi:hypothetical protein BDC45DRAFT_541331 [Circinella umbellata]|nr:hypothetical protein BDC45DRAFT_541331 [Circinella umbellata]
MTYFRVILKKSLTFGKTQSRPKAVYSSIRRKTYQVLLDILKSLRLFVGFLPCNITDHNLLIQELRPLTKNVTKLVFANPKVDIEFQPKEGDQFKYLTYLCFRGDYSSHRITAVLRYCPKNGRLRLGIFDDCNHIFSFFRPVLNRQFLSNNFRRSGRANINGMEQF